MFAKQESQSYSLCWIPAAGGPERRLVVSSVPGVPPQYAFAAAGLFCIRYDKADHTTAIDLVDLPSGDIQRVRPLDHPQRFSAPGLSMSPDGRWFLYTKFEHESDLMQFENFR